MHPLTLRVTPRAESALEIRDRTPSLWESSLLANAVFQTPTIRRMYQCLRQQARSHREGVVSAKLPAPIPASSRLKATWTPCGTGGVSRRTGFSREAVALLWILILILIFKHITPRRHKSRLGCRLDAGLAQWAERHGCRESRPPPWMADGGGPTERDRSEGTLTKEGPNQEQALLLTFGAFQK